MQRRTAQVVWPWVKGVGLLLLVVLAVEYLAVYQLADVEESWRSAGRAAPVWLVAAFLAQAASLCCYSALTYRLLPEDDRPTYPVVLAIDLTGNGFSHVVPGGGAAAAGLRLRLQGREGVRMAAAMSATTVEYAITLLWLMAAFLIGLLIAVPTPSTHPLIKTVAMLLVVVALVFGGLVAVVMARPDELAEVTHRLAKRLPFVSAESLERVVRTLIDQVRVLMRDPRAGAGAILWGLGYWGFDAACLYLSLLAFGVAANVGGLVTTYALVGLVALLPLTPGGLGLVEGIAVPVLASFGTPHSVALLGVLTWRLFGFWLAIPLALLTYLWLRVRGRGRPSPQLG